jgi:uncharacterized protein (DUF362 family)
MQAVSTDSELERLVAVARSRQANYGRLVVPVPAPELPGGTVTTVAALALRDLFWVWGLDAEHRGSPSWNPLGVFVKPGQRVTIKPNWVLHWNKSGAGLESLVTHSSLIEALLEYLCLAGPGRVVIGDAPVQGCDFGALRAACGLDQMILRFRERGLDARVEDFRRAVLPGEKLGGQRIEGARGMEHYLLYDLGSDSLLEPLAHDADRFRVTMYNPDLLKRTHQRGRHQYLVAREVIEADVVFNLPKLKSHKKACITGALKNLVGINGHKEYLPHHRKGGSRSGGDCYPGGSWLKGQAEALYDCANRLEPGRVQAFLARSGEMLLRLARAFGEDSNLEGSWYGNDTVWRTCLDLQRILRYGTIEGKLADRPQRLVISITDAIVAGEGEGPMAPTPVAAGFLTGGTNPAALEWINARLMGFDPGRIPLTRHAFDAFRYPLAAFGVNDIRVLDGEGVRRAEEVFPFDGRTFRPPAGWVGHCELTPRAC